MHGHKNEEQEVMHTQWTCKVSCSCLFLVLGFQLLCCPCCLLACWLAVFIPCGWLPFYSGGTSIIVNPGFAVEARRCFDLTLSNWAIQIEQLYEMKAETRKENMQEESDAKESRISQCYILYLHHGILIFTSENVLTANKLHKINQIVLCFHILGHFDFLV